MSKLSTIIKNPLVAIIPIVMLLLFAWQQYTLALSPINTASSNVLPNSGLDNLDTDGLPTGWDISKANAQVETTVQPGHDSPRQLAITNATKDAEDSTTLTSPAAKVTGGKTYLYKGFYTSSVPFDLILKSGKTGESHIATVVGHYDPSEEWATMSHVFTADSDTKDVQFVYRFASKGTFKIDNNYIEPDPKDVYQVQPPRQSQNLIPNATLSSDDGAAPTEWSGFSTGNNSTKNLYVTDVDGPYLQTDIDKYTSGEAKWQYAPIAIKGGQRFEFRVTYRATASAKLSPNMNYRQENGNLKQSQH